MRPIFVSTIITATLFGWSEVQRPEVLLHPCCAQGTFRTLPTCLVSFSFFIFLFYFIFFLSLLMNIYLNVVWECGKFCVKFSHLPLNWGTLLYMVSMTEDKSDCFLKCWHILFLGPSLWKVFWDQIHKHTEGKW